jgi:hypothetical protein
MSKINDFKNKNKALINDLSAVNAYISKLSISEDLASELFDLATKRREFRFLFEEFGLLKGDDFSQKYNNPIAVMCTLVASQPEGRMKREILDWSLIAQRKLNHDNISNDELISLLDDDFCADEINTDWFFRALSVPRGDVGDIKILILLWLSDRRIVTKTNREAVLIS